MLQRKQRLQSHRETILETSAEETETEEGEQQLRRNGRNKGNDQYKGK